MARGRTRCRRSDMTAEIFSPGLPGAPVDCTAKHIVTMRHACRARCSRNLRASTSEGLCDMKQTTLRYRALRRVRSSAGRDRFAAARDAVLLRTARLLSGAARRACGRPDRAGARLPAVARKRPSACPDRATRAVLAGIEATIPLSLPAQLPREIRGASVAQDSLGFRHRTLLSWLVCQGGRHSASPVRSGAVGRDLVPLRG